MRELGMADTSDVKFYGSTEKPMVYYVNDKDLHQQIPQSRNENKETLKKAVLDKVEQLERGFEERD